MNGEDIRKKRKQKGWGLGVVAKLTGLNPSTISKIENGYRNAKPSTIKLIIDALNKDFEKTRKTKPKSIRQEIKEGVYLTREQGDFYKKSIISKGFGVSEIAENVLQGRKNKNKRDALTRIIKGELKVSFKEIERLNFYVNCHIISDEEYKDLKYKEEQIECIKKCLNKGVEQ